MKKKERKGKWHWDEGCYVAMGQRREGVGAGVGACMGAWVALEGELFSLLARNDFLGTQEKIPEECIF